jgi:hypothetical protein
MTNQRKMGYGYSSVTHCFYLEPMSRIELLTC